MIIVKHKFFAARGKGGLGKVAAIGKTLAHLRYIVHRPGEDRERGGRDLFNDKEDRLNARDVKQAIKDLGNAKVIAHKLALSPEITPPDKKAYARDVMKNLSRDMGLDLDWVAAEHANTDHHHVHVVVMGKDRNGTEVNISLADIDKAKEYSDTYIQRLYPREFERLEKEREEKEREREQAQKLEKEERIREGLELPWMRKAIIREQLTPYKEWKQKQEHKREQGEKGREEPKRSYGKPIEAAGKEWSKANSLQELRELNEHLWENQEDRIPHDDYKKLVAWIHEKEQLAKYPNLERKAGRGGKAKPEERERDHFEHNGEKYSSSDSYEKLTELSQSLRDKKDRLPIEDYQNLRGWIEDKGRERWAGALGKQIDRDVYKFENSKTASDLKAAEGGRLIDPMQQSLAGNPVMKLFMFEASLARMFVAAIPLTENRDKLKDSRDELEKAKKDLAQSRGSEGVDKLLGWSDRKAVEERQEKQRESIDKAIERNEKAQAEREIEEKRKKEERERGREDRDSFERDSWGRY